MRPSPILVLSTVLCLGACSTARDGAREHIRPTYDKATGKLTELAFDADRNGRIETWTEMNGNKPVRSRIDRNEDGRIDRWEYFDGDGNLVKVGFSRKDSGTPDAWAFAERDGTVSRVEISSVGDETRIDRREYYGASPGGSDAARQLSRAEEDTDRNGRADKWETYEKGALRTVAFDENGDGVPDRRLTYEGTSLAWIESRPDAAGRFATRIRAN
ncbi:MAG TPA: hypothetical protein VD833_03410 [Vicinamibacterales bacterium]|nr:hypothetical protein [Vicinamibacterales bacterium]